MRNYKIEELSNITEIIMGQSPSSNTYNEEGEGIPFFQGKAEFRRKYPEVKKYCSQPIKLAKQNDILMSVRAPVGSINIANTDCCIGRGLCAIRPNPELNFLYLYHFMKLNEREIEGLGQGSTFKAVNKQDVERIKIPLPPLPIQAQIVAILEKAERLKEKREQANQETNKIIQSVFYEMFGDPIANTNRWQIRTVNDMCENIVDCPHSTPKYSEEITPYPCIRTSELKSGHIDWSTMKYLNEGDYRERVKRLIPIKGDIVYGREGTFGEAVIIPKGIKMSLGQRVMLFRPNKKLCNSEFLWFMVRSDYVYHQAANSTSGSTVAHVNVGDIKKIRVFSPPIELQNEFASIVEKVESLKERQRQSTQEINTLFDALLQKAFNGELVA